MIKACNDAGLVKIPADKEPIPVNIRTIQLLHPEHFFIRTEKGLPVMRKAPLISSYGFRITFVHSSPCS